MTAPPPSVSRELDATNVKNRREKILVDGGIRELFKRNVLSGVDIEGKKRLQPASIDMVLEHAIPDSLELDGSSPPRTVKLEPNSFYQIFFSEEFQFGNFEESGVSMKSFFPLSSCLRSSNVQIGMRLANRGKISYDEAVDRMKIYVQNGSPNTVGYKNERFAQVFVGVDYNAAPQGLMEAERLAFQEQLRGLNMAIEVTSNEAMQYLLRSGFAEIERPGKPLEMKNGQVQLHLGEKAYRLKKADTPVIDFARRKPYLEWEEISLKDGYTVGQGEHIRVMSEECIRYCSPNVAMQLHDNFKPKGPLYRRENGINALLENAITCLFDPGFMMAKEEKAVARYPFLPGTEIQAGMPFTRVKSFFTKRGVDEAYGSKAGWNQHQLEIRFNDYT